MHFLMGVFVALVFGACGVASAADANEQGGFVGAHGLRLPGTFTGTVPCADCAGIRHHLDLWPDQVFHLRREWLGEEIVVDDIGRWVADPQRQALILYGGGEMPLQFEIKGADRLRLLDIQGNPIVSDLPYDLARSELDPFEPQLRIHGMARYMADAARLTECLTGRSYPIAMEDDFPAFEKAYRESGVEPGGEVMISFKGAIRERPKMEGDGTEPTIVIEDMERAVPDRECKEPEADITLSSVYWIPDIPDAPAEASGVRRREPYVVFLEDRTRFAATAGCNQIIGKVNISDEGMEFQEPIASTMMACPEPLMERERNLTEALRTTHQWRIQDGRLALSNEEGEEVLILESAYHR